MDEVNLVPLIVADSLFEMALFEKVLEKNHIPSIVRDDGAGNYMRLLTGGNTIFNATFYVDEIDYEKAKDVLTPVIGTERFK